MPRRHRFSRASRGVKNQVWASLLIDEFLMGTGVQSSFDLVAGDDWSATGGERGTILTVRGYLSITAQNDTGVKSEGQVFWYIGVIDALVPLASHAPPDAGITYVAANILDTGGHIYESIAGGTGDGRPTKDWEINIKTMRTIRATQNLVIVIKNGTGDNIRLGGLFRSLVRKGGN